MEQDLIVGKGVDIMKKGLREIFPDLRQELIDLTWSSIRCGLFHNGMTGNEIFLNTNKENKLAIALFVVNGENKVLINPHRLLDKINIHLDQYIKELKDCSNKELRINFGKMFNN